MIRGRLYRLKNLCDPERNHYCVVVGRRKLVLKRCVCARPDCMVYGSGGYLMQAKAFERLFRKLKLKPGEGPVAVVFTGEFAQ